MAEALYHPTLGYYTRRHYTPEDTLPFGASGDFYTATQVQPVFGRLIARFMHQLGEERFFDWGAGAEAMRPFFSNYTAIDADYKAIDSRRGTWPDRFRGFVFANELFDALPVDVFVRKDDEWIERRVTAVDGSFAWKEEGVASDAQRDWLDRFGPQEIFAIAEVNTMQENLLHQLASCMTSGWLLAIDYGVTRRELIRFPEGTLMSYRRHTASDDVLSDPGDCDITSHVNFDALRFDARACGFREERFETLASLLLRIGEGDAFASALDAPEPMAAGLRMQLKTLLYGMGETFRAVLWRKEEPL